MPHPPDHSLPPTRTASPQAADELLAIRCQLGEPGALDQLVDRWHLPLGRYLRRLTGREEEAAELAQEVWLRVLRSLPRLRDPARLHAWLFAIARRAAMDRLRGRYREPASEPLEPEILPAPEPEPDREEELQIMEEQLTELPLVEREVLALFYLEELSLAQIAEVLEIPVGTVKSRLHRARRLLRQRIEQRSLEP